MSLRLRVQSTIASSAFDEEVRPDQNYGPCCDVFALGCIYSEMYTIMQQKSLEEYREFIGQGAGLTPYRDCISRTQNWLQLFDETRHCRLVDLIISMTMQKPEDRTSAEVAFFILTSGCGFLYCCKECVSRAELGRWN